MEIKEIVESIDYNKVNEYFKSIKRTWPLVVEHRGKFYNIHEDGTYEEIEKSLDISIRVC